MTPVGGVQGAGGTVPLSPSSPRGRMRQLAHDLEGVFLNQLFLAMRQSIPQDGVIEPAPGQDMFTQLFDEKIASEASRHSTRGLGEALYRQLAARLPAQDTTEER